MLVWSAGLGWTAAGSQANTGASAATITMTLSGRSISVVLRLSSVAESDDGPADTTCDR